ncbi:aftiphilin-like isoform X3 [Homarus americanus]|nr:aftiphilin-like isoform X3 [Homarus americanus]
MAFQMIPPRLSSSPPPLDSLPTVTCPGEEDDDEEFGNFSTHNASFDITGLSDKLPPTPDTSPSKFPALGHVTGKILPAVLEGIRDDTISQDSGVGSSNHPNEFSPQPQADDHSFGDFSTCVTAVFKVNNERTDGVGVVKNDGDDGLNNFQAFTSAGDEPPRIQEPECSTYSSDPNIDQGNDNFSSQVFPTVSETPEGSGKRSPRNSFSMIGTPPPLDYVANSVTVDDEFSRFSPNHRAAADDDDDEFGDFTSNEISEIINGKYSYSESVVCEKISIVPNNEEVTLQQSVKVMECSSLKRQENLSISLNIDDDVTNTSKENNADKNVDHPSQDASHSNSSSEKVSASPKSVPLSTSICSENSSQISRTPQDKVLNFGDRTPSISLQSENIVTKSTDKKDDVSASVSEKTKNDFIDVSKSNIVQEVMCSSEKVDSQSKEAEEQVETHKTGESEWTDHEHNSFKSKSESENYTDSKSHVSAYHYDGDVSSEVRIEGRTGKENHSEFNCDALQRGAGNDPLVSKDLCVDDFGDFDKVDSQGESDFGDFSKANEDDDLDFADLREQVENGTYGAEETLQPGIIGDDEYCEDVDDEFGDFNAPVAVTDSEFGDLDSANVDDDDDDDDEFGDFAVHDKVGASSNLTCAQAHDLEEDFGAFSGQGDTRNFGDFSMAGEETGKGNFATSWKEASFENSCKSPVLKKLESLVLKWIPRDPASIKLQEEQPVATLHEAVESDAFVWRQLENLESSAALTLSWGNTRAHNLFLSSVNVDARNIVSKEALITLFGQKWSSSVPLFAQTLSFSPLTPAKPTEGTGGPSVGYNGCSREPTTPPATASVIPPKLKEEVPVAVSAVKDGSSEVSTATKEISSPEQQESSLDQVYQVEQIPPAKFDWTSSGLTNPLEVPAYNSSLFGLDLLLTNTSIGKGATNALLASLEREFLSESGEKNASTRIKSPPTPSPLVQQILGSGLTKGPLTNTPLHSLVPEVRQVVEHLPDLGFMRSRVLMFPIRGEQ